jgi:hypothetical protein
LAIVPPILRVHQTSFPVQKFKLTEACNLSKSLMCANHVADMISLDKTEILTRQVSSIVVWEAYVITDWITMSNVIPGNL